MKSSALAQRRTRPRASHSPVAWLFRTNLPPRRGAPLPPHVHKRNFFGLGEVVGVLANPGETLKSLADARRALDDARTEMRTQSERAQLRTPHTFVPLPGFFPRPAELTALRRALGGAPAFTVLFGASSAGKTALLREVLSGARYHVLHFDLRIAGFADLGSLYAALSRQMELWFEEVSSWEGWGEFEREAWGFKHDRMNVERLVESNGPDYVKTSDIARLMELFQSSLLRYWEFEPTPSAAASSSSGSDAAASDETKVDVARSDSRASSGKGKGKLVKPAAHVHKGNERADKAGNEKAGVEKAKAGPGEERTAEADSGRPAKKIPVLFLDEAHKLPALIRSGTAMKCLLDAMLVLTKQDRLCHVVHATSDSFYLTWLRRLNVMQHCKIIVIGDCTKEETQAYFFERLLPGVPENLRAGLSFNALYDAFGGKLVHWADYVADYVNSNGDLTIKASSHFLQAYLLLNLHVLHASESDAAAEDRARAASRAGTGPPPSATSKGFRIYSPLSADATLGGADTGAAPPGNGAGAPEGDGDGDGDGPPAFTALQLLKVMRKLVEPGVAHIPYFALARELGVRAVDDMVRARVLELRWAPAVAREGLPSWGRRSSDIVRMMRAQDSVLGSDGGAGAGEGSFPYESAAGTVGPRVRPASPVVRCAMREVLREYEIEGGEGEGSEYASLSDPEEY